MQSSQQLSLSPPVIDFGVLFEVPRNEEKLKQFYKQVDEACSEWGCFVIINYPLDWQLVDDFREKQRTLFLNLSLEEKRSFERTPQTSRGFVYKELTKNKVDHKEAFDYGREELNDNIIDGGNQWPDEDRLPVVKGFKHCLLRYLSALGEVAATLSEVLVSALGEEVQPALADLLRSPSSFVRLNYYPKLEGEGHGELGVGPHKDAGLFTLLLQDDTVASLQVFHGQGEGLRKEDEKDFLTIQPLPRSLVFNLGDMMQIFTNGKYFSVVHRVLTNRGSDRFSAPFFFNPSYDADVKPFFGPAKYQTVNWGHYRRRRYEGDYADVGEEIQIAQFRK